MVGYILNNSQIDQKDVLFGFTNVLNKFMVV